MKFFGRNTTNSPLPSLRQKLRRAAASTIPRYGKTARLALAASIAMAGTLLLTPSQSRAAIIDTTFTLGVDGLWNVGSNWNNGIPNNGADTYNVFIDSNSGTNVTVALNITAAISNLTIGLGDALAINNAQSLTIASGGSVTNDGVISVNSTANVTRFAIAGNVTLSGSGSLQLGASENNFINGTGTLTNSATHTISGGGRVGLDGIGINNAGTIDANLTGVVMEIDSSITSALTNTGTLRASNGGILVLTGSNTGAFNNTGGTISALNGSEVRLVTGAAITGGILTTSGSGVIRVSVFNTASLSGVSNTGAIVVNNAGTLNVTGSLNNTGTVTLASTGNQTSLTLLGNTVLTGSGSLQVGAADTNFIIGTGTLTNSATHTISGGGRVGVDAIGFDNAGTIDANLNGVVMEIDPSFAGGLTNTGTLRASNGGILALTGSNTGAFNNTGGTISALNGSEVRLVTGAAITGGIFATTGTGVIQLPAFNTGSLSGVNNTGAFIVNNAATLSVSGSLNNTGTVTVTATGNTTTFNLSGDTALSGAGTLSLGSATTRIIGGFRLTNSSTIQGEGNVGSDSTSFTNLGLIDANLSGRTLIVDPASGIGTFVNAGTLRASNGGFLSFTGSNGGNFTSSGSGIITATGAGSEVLLTGGVGVVDSTFSTSAGGIIRTVDFNVVSLPNVTNNGAFVGNNGSTTNVSGTLTNNGTLTLNASGSNTSLALTADATLTGTGALVLASTNASSTARVTGAFRLTNTSTIQGQGNLGDNSTAITNIGVIDANITGRTLTVDPASVANAFIHQGTLRASNGGILSLTGSGGGAFTSTNGSAITATGAGSEVRLSDTFSLADAVFDTTAGGVIRTVDFNTVSLSNVTNNGTFIAGNGSTTNVSAAIINNGTLRLDAIGSLTNLTLTADTTLTGTGSLVLGSTGANSFARVLGAFRLTNNSTIQGEGDLGTNSAATTNNGVIDANITGRTLTVDPANVANAFVNQGTLRASNGGILFLTGSGGGAFTSTNGSAITATGAGSEVRLSGSVNLADTVLNTTGGGVIRNVDFQIASLSNVTNNGTFIAGNGSTTNVSAAIVNNGTIKLDANGTFTNFVLTADTTLTGTGSLVLGSININSPARVLGAFRLTNSNTIQGEGELGTGASTFTNNGIIDANITGRTLTVDPVNVADALLNTATGIVRASNGGTLLLFGGGGGSFTNNGTFEAVGGTLTMDATAILTNNLAGILTGGTYRAVGATMTIQGSAISQIAANTTVELNGAGSVFQVAATPIETSLTTTNGTLKVLGNRNYTTANAIANGATAGDTAVLQLGGGTFNSLSLINRAGSTIFGFGNITPRPTNFGLIRSSGGTLAFASGIQGGSGTVQIDAGSTLDLSGGAVGSSADFLIHNGTTLGSLNLGANTFTVTADYTNANFGTGNTFAPRANVGGVGGINAGGNTAQRINGDVTGGTTATPGLALPNIHEGDSVTRNFAVANTGSVADSPALRGALQAAGFGNITDPRLSGTGVTAQNFGPVAPAGQTGNFAITLSGTTPGALAAGQTVGVVNNFDNVAEQNISITGGSVYRLAIAGPLSPNPAQLASVREGGTFAAIPLTGSNAAVDFAGFTELMNGVLSGPSANVVGNGSITNLAPGASDNTSLSVNLTDTAVGAHSGTVSFNPTSVALAGSGLTNTALTAQPVTVNGSIYRAAVFTTVTPSPVSLASIREGGTFTAAAVSVNNGATNIAGFTEALSTAFSSPAVNVSAIGSITGLAPGSTNNTAMTLALTDTATAGAKSGLVNIAGTSVPVAGSGLTNLSLGTQSLSVQGSVFRAAIAGPLSPNAVQLASIREGGTFAAAPVTASNTAVNIAGFTESLNGVFSGPSANVVTAGSIASLAPSTFDAVSLTIRLTDTAVGAHSGDVSFNPTSVAVAGSGLANLPLTSQTLAVNGSIYRAAVFTPVTPSPISLANIREGGTFTPVAISVNNGAANFAGFTEALSTAFSGPGPNVSAIGSVANLAPGGTNSSAMTVSLTDTATAGAKTGAVNIAGTSVPVGGSGLTNLSLGSQPLAVQGSVFRLAAASVPAPASVDFGVVHVGETPSQAIGIQNTAANDTFSERLNASFSGTTGDATASGSFSQLNPQSNSTSLSVGINTASVGNKLGTATIALASDGTGTSGLGVASVGTQTVNIQGQVNFLAAPRFVFTLGSGTLFQNNATTFTLDFGSVAPNTGILNASLGVLNFLQDVAFQDTLGGAFSAGTVASYTLTGFNTFSNIASGNQLAVGVGFNTARAPGTYNESLTLNPASTNTSGTTPQSSVQLNLRSEVVPEPGSFLLFTIGGGLLLGRRRRRNPVGGLKAGS